MFQPQLPLAQTGERRAGQGIERALAPFASPAMELVRLSLWLHMRVPAVRTCWSRCAPGLQDFDRLSGLVHAGQHPDCDRPLASVELAQITQKLLKIGRTRRGIVRSRPDEPTSCVVLHEAPPIKLFHGQREQSLYLTFSILAIELSSSPRKILIRAAHRLS